MPKVHYDIAIVGLGPAGATLARLLSGRYAIIALDRKQLDGKGFEKPCGGLLANDAQKALARFNLTLPKSVLVDPQIFAVKTIDVEKNLIVHYQRFYLNVDRQQFDRWLISLIPSAVHVKTDAVCKNIDRQRDGSFLLQYEQEGLLEEVSARYVIGADGAFSMVRNRFFSHKKLKSYVAIQQCFPSNEQMPFYSCIFDRTITSACAWGLFKDNRFIFGGAFEKQHCRKQFEALKDKLKEMGFAFGDPLETQACQLLCPTSPLSFVCGEENVFLIGEAAGFISPSSFEGISFALESARALSDALRHGESQIIRLYRRYTRHLRLKLTMKIMKRPFLYTSFWRGLIMKSGIKSIKVLS